MRAIHRRSGFTLIEVLIVVAIVAIMAVAVMPQVTGVTEDAKQSALKHNLYVLRAQIEMYKVAHNGKVPALLGNTLPQLLSATSADGTIGTPGPSQPFGPYLTGGRFPANPFDNFNTVTATSQFPPTASTAAGGWLYEPLSGRIAPNTDGHLDD